MAPFHAMFALRRRDGRGYMRRIATKRNQRFMKRPWPAAFALICVLTACADRSNIGVTTGGGPKSVQTASRSEPVFYNGAEYKLDYDYNEALKVFDVRISGTTRPMKPDAQKDAVNITLSSLGYFACPDGQKGRVTNSPAFAKGVWSLQARCG
jgi:hypothetical protein